MILYPINYLACLTGSEEYVTSCPCDMRKVLWSAFDDFPVLWIQ